MTTKIEWASPEIDKKIAYMARVSNPANQDNENIAGLLNYCMREGHVSPFEMASVCMEVNTTRDIARQILRHRSFSFQEFSQRYQDTNVLGEMVEREGNHFSVIIQDSAKAEPEFARLQHPGEDEQVLTMPGLPAYLATTMEQMPVESVRPRRG